MLHLLTTGPHQKATDLAAGYDLFAQEDGAILPHCRYLVPLGIRWTQHVPFYAVLMPRSGLALRHGIMVMAGLIDGDYQDEWKALLYNSGDDIFNFKKGERIVQAVLSILPASTQLSAARTGGFGSTGNS